MNSVRSFMAFVLFMAVSTGATFAQGGATGAISGVVQDASGAVIANAKVNLKSEATGEVLRQVTTDSSGLFTATLLPVGNYSVEVTASGFPVTTFPGVIVRITETTRMTATLKVNTVRQVVEVQSQVEQVNTTDATTGQSLGAQTITDLPLATRNFQQLLTLSTGASADLNGAAQLGRGNVFIHVNGGREDNNNYLIEGITVADYAFGELTYTPLPSPDAIEEFKVSTSLYDATQGRNGGGNINATLKGGTNHFHGDLWEYFRNTALDANDYFLGKVVVKQNIFGGDVGGPIGRGAKLGFFYFNLQGTRQRSGDSAGTFINTTIPVIPTDRSLSNLESVFSSPAAPNCPAFNLTAVDPVALNLLNFPGSQFGPGGFLFPTVPGTPGVTQTFNAATGTCSSAINYGPLVLTDPGKFSDNQFTANWDREFRGGKDHLSWRFFWSNSDTFEPFGADSFGIQTGGLPGTNNLNFPLDIPLHSRFGSITETHVFSNTLINEFRFGVNIISDKLNNEAPVTGAQIGINLPTATGVNGQAGDPNMYRLQFGTFGFGPYTTQLQSALSDNYTWLDTVSWTHGPHQLRLGGEIDRVAMRRNLPIADNGLIFFVAGATGFPTDFQSFLAGSPLLGEGGGGLGNHDYRVPGYAWFAQDDYRVSKTLTLNLGFRNEFNGAPYDTLCHTGNTIPTLANTTGQPYVYPKCVNKFGLSGITGTLNQAGLGNEYATVWEPRIGFAYDVGGRHTTSIRGGYGIYSVREDLGAADNLAITPPTYPFLVGFAPGAGTLANLFASSPAFPNGIPPLGANPTQKYVPTAAILQGFAPCTFPTPQACSPLFSGNVNSLIQLTVPQHWVSGTTQQWNLTIQHELGRDWFMELGYVGTKGSRLRSTFDPDQATLATPQNPVTVSGAGCTNLLAQGLSCQIVDSTVENASARAPFLGIAPPDFEDFAPNSDSRYNALQATLAHRFGKGLYFQSAYTWSKSIDDVSTASVAFLTRVNNQTDAAASRGLSDFDRRQRFVTSGVYQLPFFGDANGFTKAALGGWEASGVVILQSGAPFSILDPAGGSVYALASTPSSTATFNPGFSCANAPSHGSPEARIGNWVNPLAYQPDPAATLSNGTPSDGTLYGNTPRNCIIGPPQKNVDLTLGKTFKLGERQNLRFRTDFFNLFNHPSFAIPAATSVSASGGGSAPITSTVGTPRLIQFSLKYSF
ncbi:MAG TPA: carboxypeptidase-like regulatory domain-containing protein [Candidatus Deferrimicrobiaceae bacterium]|nr:carboxypeptidase-like regulatory domain-containing protein [Candidatus Deferrimicrobiaceae bacterium]